MTILVAPSKAI